MNRRTFFQHLVAATILTPPQRAAAQRELDGLHRNDESPSPTLGGLLWIEAVPNSGALPSSPEEGTAVHLTESDEALFFVRGPGWIPLTAHPPGASAAPRRN